MIAVPAITFLAGLLFVVAALLSTLRTFVLPRAAPDVITRFVFVMIRRVFDFLTFRSESYETRDRIMAFFAPISLLLLLPTWLFLVLVGYAAMFWVLGTTSSQAAIKESGSSLLTLGFVSAEDFPRTVLALTEATIGLMLVALLIAYLPTIYSAFSRREAAVTLLEVRAGNPPSAVEMIKRFHRIHGLDRLSEQWRGWEEWFADVEESHTSLAVLVYFRSHHANRSWVTAAGTVLDAASLVRAVVDIPGDPQADLCIRAGYIALRRIADFFSVPYDPNPKPTDPTTITREEFDEACRDLEEAGVPLVADRDRAWLDFNGWRVNYDIPLLTIANLTMAPYAPWSSDRGPVFRVSVLPRSNH